MSRKQKAETQAAMAFLKQPAPITAAVAVNVVTLISLARTINASFDTAAKADTTAYDARIAAGKALLDAKTKVEAAPKEHGTFAQWCAANIKRSKADIYRCLKLAQSPDPVAAREAEKATAREGMARTNAARAAIVTQAEKIAAVSKLETSAPKPSAKVWGDVTIGLPSASATRDAAVVAVANDLGKKTGSDLATHIETQIRLLSDVQWTTISEARRGEIARLVRKMIERIETSNRKGIGQ